MPRQLTDAGDSDDPDVAEAVQATSAARQARRTNRAWARVEKAYVCLLIGIPAVLLVALLITHPITWATVQRVASKPELHGSPKMWSLFALAERLGWRSGPPSVDSQMLHVPSDYREYIHDRLVQLQAQPDSPRLMFELGVAFAELAQNPGHDHLATSFAERAALWLEQRASLEFANHEEAWYSRLKLGEINSRVLKDQDEARRWWEAALQFDPDRPEPLFYLGQQLLLEDRPAEALPHLVKAVKKPLPDRGLYVWHDMYQCLAPTALVNCVHSLPDGHPRVTASVLKLAMRLGKDAVRGCQLRYGDQIPALQAELAGLSKRKPAPPPDTGTKTGPGKETEKGPPRRDRGSAPKRRGKKAMRPLAFDVTAEYLEGVPHLGAQDR